MLLLRSRTGPGASFRDYTADQSHTPHAVMEAALAHMVRQRMPARRTSGRAGLGRKAPSASA